MATAKKTTSRRSTSSAKKTTPAKKAARSGSARKSSAPRAQARPKPSAGQVAERAAAQLLELTGKGPEGVTGLERTDDGWRVLVDVVELRRVPDSTDVLASYEVEVDADGDLRGYRRLRRFVRGTAGEE